MSIEAMKRIKALLQDTDKIDSHTISAVVAECDMVILAQQPDNAACKSVQKRLESQRPASKEHLFELWWEAHMPNATQEQAWTAFTAAVASNGVGIAAQQPATGEPVLFIHPDTFAMNNAHVGAWKPGHELTGYIPLYTHPVPSLPGDVVRDAISTVREHYRGTDWGKAAESICDAIDAMLAAK